ncbi:MAG: branched-chain amino acid ABC transporter permease [Candidatus Kaiserbacteria bacterium]|nr:branched-chain amino acid ABC transporter permease [Candidatus Kaiserbacteria bacterium]
MDVVFQIVANSIIAGSLYTLIASGFTLTYSTTKFFNITHGVMTAVGAYTVFFLGKILGMPLLLAIIVGVLFAGLLGWVLNYFIYQPLRKKNASQLSLLVASLGAFTAIQACISLAFSSQFQTISHTAVMQKTFSIVGASVTQIQLIIVASALISFVSLTFFLKKTRFGTAIRAVSDDEEVAKVIGINTDKVIGIAFFIASALAGLAGILIGFDSAIEPTMGLALLMKGVTASIVGGLTSIFGAVVGSFLVSFVENFGIFYTAGEWRDAIVFTLLIIFLMFRPNGIIRT